MTKDINLSYSDNIPAAHSNNKSFVATNLQSEKSSKTEIIGDNNNCKKKQYEKDCREFAKKYGFLKKRRLVSNEDFESLGIIYANVREIFREPRLNFFTIHDDKHSIRMLDNLLKLFPSLFSEKHPNKLNEKEVFCLIASIFLHDIGVQLYGDSFLDEYCKKKCNRSKLDNKTYFLKSHHYKLSSAWIIDSARKEDKIKPRSYVGNEALATYVADICFSHGVKKFESYKKYTKERKCGTISIRMGLLCTLLSLGDALDCYSERVHENTLKDKGLSDKDRILLMKYYYVTGVNIREGYLTLEFTFPNTLDASNRKVYEYYFWHNTRIWLSKHNQKRLQFLLDSGINYDVFQDFHTDSIKDELTNKELCKIRNDSTQLINSKIKKLHGLKQEMGLCD